MTRSKLTRQVLAKHLSLCGYEVFGERYAAVEAVQTPGGVLVDLAAVSTVRDPVVHAVACAATYSEALQALGALSSVKGEGVANALWLATTLETLVALGEPKELKKRGFGLAVVEAEESLGLGSARVSVELEAKIEARKARWPGLEEKLRASGKVELAELLAKTLGKKPKV